jgi:glycosyltransferase involved in cell wall biosynthesis
MTVVAAGRRPSQEIERVALPAEVDVVRVPVGRADWIGLGFQAARYLGRHERAFDLVHFADVHFAYAYRGPYIANGLQSFRQRLSSCRGRTYGVNRQDLMFRTLYYNAARRLAERPAVRRAQHMIMISETTRSEFVRHYGIPREKTSVSHIGVDLRRFDEMEEQTAARRALDLPADVPVLLYVGFSTARKGVEYLGAALGELPAVHLLMVGKWEKGYRERFWRSVGACRDRVRVAGYVPDDELLTYFAAADVFVLPSWLEGFGIPLVEAMAAGLPIVTTTGSATSEIVGDAGIAIAPGDSQALARAVHRLLTDGELARRLRRRGRERAQALFDEQRMIDDIEVIYLQAAKARHGG